MRGVFAELCFVAETKVLSLLIIDIDVPLSIYTYLSRILTSGWRFYPYIVPHNSVRLVSRHVNIHSNDTNM